MWNWGRPNASDFGQCPLVGSSPLKRGGARRIAAVDDDRDVPLSSAAPFALASGGLRRYAVRGAGRGFHPRGECTGSLPCDCVPAPHGGVLEPGAVGPASNGNATVRKVSLARHCRGS